MTDSNELYEICSSIRKKIKKNVNEGNFSSSQLGERLVSLKKRVLHLGKLSLERGDLRIKKLRPAYKSSLIENEVVPEEMADMELLEKGNYCLLDPNYIENTFRKCVAMSGKSPEEGVFLNLFMSRKKDGSIVYVEPQISFFCEKECANFYGTIDYFFRQNGNQVLVTELCRSYPDCKEKRIYRKNPIDYSFEDLHGFKKLKTGLNGVYTAKITKTFMQDSCEDSPT